MIGARVITFFLLAACAAISASAQSPRSDTESPACIPLERAADYAGKTVCISGKVTKVWISRSGAFVVEFYCVDTSIASSGQKPPCPFSAVVFKQDTDKTGDLRVLRGKTIELSGKIKNYKGKPEIVITSRAQIKTDAFIPALPAEFGADRQKPTNLGQFPSGSKRDRAW